MRPMRLLPLSLILWCLVMNAAGDPTELTSRPSNVTARPFSASSILLRWAPPTSSRNSRITGYKIRYRMEDDQSAKVIKIDGSLSEFILEDLERDTVYEIRMAAFNFHGTGPLSDWIPSRTLQYDGNVQPAFTQSIASDVQTTTGATLRLSCPVSGDPHPIMTWSKESLRLIVGGKYSINGDHLIIHDVDEGDQGSYCCTARNSFGSVSTSMELTVVEPTIESPATTESPADGTDGQSEELKPKPQDQDNQVKNETTDTVECDIKPRRYDVTNLGEDCFFRGWADVQGQGASNDYCRIVGGDGRKYVSCALAGTEGESEFNYNSVNATLVWMDAGHKDTWYMRDEDGDGRDDYCRCVGELPETSWSCMKAGETGFIGLYDFTPSNVEPNCHDTKVNPFFGPRPPVTPP